MVSILLLLKKVGIRSRLGLLRKAPLRVLGFFLGPLGRFCLKATRSELLPGGFENRLGHQVDEPLYLYLARRAGTRVWNKAFVLWDESLVANTVASSALPSDFIFVRSKWIRKTLSFFSKFIYDDRMKSPLECVGTSVGAAEVHRVAWLVNRNFEFFTVAGEALRFTSTREMLGVPTDRWICCLHIREPGLFPADGDAHNYRNADPAKLELAVGEIILRGGFVIRLGSPEFTPLDFGKNFLDLAHHPLRSEAADFFLARGSRFFLGNSSGGHALASSRGVPLVAVNVAPFGAAKVWGPQDLAIPKLYKNSQSGELISFGKLLSSGHGDIRSSEGIHALGYAVVENSPEEILAVTTEMLDRLDGVLRETPADLALQHRMQALFTPRNYTYYSETRIGAEFLRTYEHLVN